MLHSAGRLEAIWLKRSHWGPMDRVDRAAVVAGRGLVGNAHQGGRRQVTLVEREVFTALRDELGVEVDPGVRRANLLLSGVSLADSRGRVLQIGGVHLRVAGETRPCERMDRAVPGLRNALAGPWRGGAYGEVLADGDVAVGDSVRWVTPES